MSERAANSCYKIEERKVLLESLGGLPAAINHNAEWLDLLREDTRQSLAIEGYFASEERLEAVLRGHKTDLEFVNYFRIAQTAYDQAVQYRRDNAVAPLNISIIRHFHSELFRASGTDSQRGRFRGEPIRIHGAKVSPPEADVDAYVQAAIGAIKRLLESYPILPALARAHALFESIHPFSDGNGRLGRVLLNYLAISRGYPPIVIKGATHEERQRYYHALEAGDKGFHRGLPNPNERALLERLEEGDFEQLSLLLCEGLLPRLDRMIALALERQEPLIPLADLAPQLGVKESALRVRLLRGRLIAIKRGNKLYSHAQLAL